MHILFDLYHLKTMVNAFAQLWMERISIGGNSIIVNTRCTDNRLNSILLTECLITWDMIMLVPHVIYQLKAIINGFQMTTDRKAFYPRLCFYYRYKIGLWKSIQVREWLITSDIFEIIDRTISPFEALFSAFKRTTDRKPFYPRFLSYCEYKTHLPNLMHFKECPVTQDIVRLMLHGLHHWKAIIHSFTQPRTERLSICG
jgi:hypothetical protein